MDTPIADFVRAYQRADMARLHMPGHKGRGSLGCEGLDISEVNGADALYEAEGIIARSEENASAFSAPPQRCIPQRAPANASGPCSAW